MKRYLVSSSKQLLQRAKVSFKNIMHTRDTTVSTVIPIVEESLSQLSVSIVVTDAYSNIVWVNRAFTELTGYSTEELIGKKPGTLLQGTETDPATIAYMAECVKKKQDFSVDVLNYSKNKNPYWVRIQCSPVYSHNHTLKYFVAVQSEITEAKKIEKQFFDSQQLMTDILYSASEVSIIATNTDGIITLFNRGAELLLGYSKDEMLNKQTPIVFHDIDEVTQRSYELSEELGQKIEGFQTFVVKAKLHRSETREWTYITKSGARRRVSLVISAMRKLDGSITGYLGIAIDVTETLLAKQQLEESENRYRTLVEYAPEAIVVFDCETRRFVDMNKNAETLFSLSGEDKFNYGPMELSPLYQPDGRRSDEAALEYIQAALDDKYPIFDWTHVSLPGKEIQCRVHLVRLPSLEKKLIRGSIVDISDYKHIEKRLQRSQKRLELVYRATNDAIWDWNYQTGETYYSQRWYEMLGYENEEFSMTFDTFKDLCHPEDFVHTVESIQMSLEAPDASGYIVEFRIKHKNGSWVWIEGRGDVVERDVNGTPLVLAGRNTDITSKKQTELELYEKSGFLDTIYQGVDFGIIVVDVLPENDFRIVGMNPSMENSMGLKNIGITQQDLQGKTFSEIQQLPWASRDGIERDKKRLLHTIESKQPVEIEESTFVRQDDGTFKLQYSLERHTPVFNQRGEVYRIITTLFDITDKANIQKQLKTNEQFLHSVFMGSSNGIVVFDVHESNKFYLEAINNAYTDLLGITDTIRSDYIENLTDVFSPSYVSILSQELSSCLECEKIVEYTHPHNNIFIYTRLTPLHDESRNVYRIIVSVDDITKELEIERELRESEQFLQTIYNNVPYGIMVVDVRDNTYVFLSMNPSYENLIGISSDVFDNLSIDEIRERELLPKDGLEYVLRHLDECRMTGKNVEYERTAIRNGKWSTWLFRMSPLTDDNNSVRRIIVTTTDVTKRAMAEIAMRSLVDTTSSVVGREFFASLVNILSTALRLDHVFVGEFSSLHNSVKTISYSHNGILADNFEYSVLHTPCDIVLSNQMCLYQQDVQQFFPNDVLLQELNIQGYIGVPLMSVNDQPLGVLVGLSCSPIQESEYYQSLFSIFATRVRAEFERIRAESDLIYEKEYVKDILESTPAIVVDLDMSGNTISVNSAVTQVTGYEPYELIGQNWFQVFYPSDLYAQVDELNSVIVQGIPVINYEMELMTKHGEMKVVAWNAAIRKNEDGTPLSMTGIGVDVTDAITKKKEKAIVEKLQSERRSLEVRNELLRLSQLDGYRIEEIYKEILRTVASVCHVRFVSYWEIRDDIYLQCLEHFDDVTSTFHDNPQSRQFYLPDMPLYYEKLLQSRNPIIVDDVFSSDVTMDLAEYFMSFGIRSLLDISVYRNGIICGVFCVEHSHAVEWTSEQIDFVTSIARLIEYYEEKIEKTKVQENLLQSEGRFLTIFESSPLPMAIVTLESSIIVEVNSAWSYYLGIPREEAIGRSNYDLGIIQNVDEIITQISIEFEHKGELRNFPMTLRTAQGELRAVLLSFSILMFNGKKHGLSVFVDIEKEKKAQRQMELARIIAEDSSRAKSEFLANMSHEIRTPMNAILGFTDILREQVKEPILKKHLDTINASGRTLLVLINDILDLSKIESGKLHLDYDPVYFHTLVESTYGLFYPIVQKKKLDYSIHIADDVPKVILFDEVRLQQVLFNVIGNAVKFTENGNVNVNISAVHYHHPSHPKVTLRIVIHDSGIGIPADQLESIFEAFKQQDGQTTRKFGGTGLGLAITRKLLEAMGGSIHVESELGSGSTFTITLENVEILSDTHSEANELRQLQSISVDFKGESVLIVDDILENRELLKYYLINTGIIIYEAVNGVDAVSLARRHKPSLILMDLRMPVMNGIEASQIIKSDPSISHIPIIAVTASGLLHEEKFIQEICERYLRKPVHKNVLLTEMNSFLKKDIVYGIDSSLEQSIDTSLNEEMIVTEHQKVFAQQLYHEFLDDYSDVKKMVVIPRIRDFATRVLDRLNEGPDLPMLRQYLLQILDDCQHFNIVALKESLQHFLEILQKTL